MKAGLESYPGAPEVGFETIGNATLIFHDGVPILATDPWIEGLAYFGSWGMSHEIPAAQRSDILACPYIWFSHGHPDHLNPDSLPLFKGRIILLPDHVGGRIYKDLCDQGFEVRILPDRQWIELSPRLKVLCIADMAQDAILLADINGRLVVNSNDSADNGWGWFVKRTARRYPISFLLALASFGDADMMNFHTEDGKFITPPAARKVPFGPGVARSCERLGMHYFIPFSSMHTYRRTDSAWANQYTATPEDCATGFVSSTCTLLPAFISCDCAADRYWQIDPPPASAHLLEPSEFGDNWSERLTPEDLAAAEMYFRSIRTIHENIGFIVLRVGGSDHRIELGAANRGITFEVPRHSLMCAIQYEIFDDLLIGNFMKTTLHGAWPSMSLNPYFARPVTKFADNGRVKSAQELAAYMAKYESRSAQLRFLRMEQSLREWVAARAGGSESRSLQWAKHAYRRLRSLAG